MSARDRSLMDALDLSVVNVADIVEMSRQTVSKKISKSEFFNVPTLKKIYDHQCNLGSDECVLTARVIEQYFHEFSDIVIGQNRDKHDSTVKGFDAGEYWFVCYDFNHFRASYTRAYDDLKRIAQNGKSTLVLFVASEDRRGAARFSSKHGSGRVRIVECSKQVSPVPLLSKLRTSGGADIFVPSSTGFYQALEFDATKVRALVQDVFDEVDERIDQTPTSSMPNELAIS